MVLDTDQFNNYPNRTKLLQVKSENNEEIKRLTKHIHYGKIIQQHVLMVPSAYYYLKDGEHLINGVIGYKESNYLMYLINIQISNTISNIV